MEWNEQTSGTDTNAGTGSSTSTNTIGGASGSTVEDAKEKARQAATDAQRKVSDELRSRVDSTRSRAADALGSVAQALTTSVQQLRTENQAVPSEYVERAGNQIRRASEYLRNTNTDDLVRNAEGFARRQPAVFLGGAFVLGFLAARLVKSSQTTSAGGSIPHDRSLVPASSAWNTDRETPVSGFREPAMGGRLEDDTDPTYTRQFGRETL
jgi:gas vesicle protein